MRTIKILAPFLLLFLPIVIFFSPVWLQGKLPIPADTIPGLYHPMRDALAHIYPNGPAFKNFVITDAVRQQYPWRQFAIEELKQGRIPWWNPYNFSGSPLVASFQSASFYPLNLVFWLTDFTTGWTVLIVLQFLLGTLFMYAFLRYLHLHQLASTLGSLTWIFSGFFIAWLEWNTAVHVAIWSPLILLAISTILTNRSQTIIYTTVWMVILFVSLICQFYAGYPQPWLYLSLIQVAYVVWVFVNQKPQVNRLVQVVLAYFLAVLVMSPMLLLTLELSKFSNRTLDQGNVLDKPDWFIPYQQLIQILVPDFFGNPATLNYWGVFNYTEFVTYIGVSASVLVLNLILSKKKPQLTWFFCFAIGMSLLLSTRNPISELQFKLNIPFLGASQPSRWIVVINLSLSILAALGLDQFIKRKLTLTKGFIATGIILVTCWVIVGMGYLYYKEELYLGKLEVTFRNLVLPTGEFVILGLAGVCIFFVSKLSAKKTMITKLQFGTELSLSVVFLACVTLAGLRFGQKFTSFSNKEFLYPHSKILTFLQKNQQLYRYATNDSRIMSPNMNMPYKLYSIEGYDPLYLKDYGRLMYATELGYYPKEAKPYNRTPTTTYIDSPIIDVLGVKYVLTFVKLDSPDWKFVMQEGQTLLYENNQVFPRAFTTQSKDIFTIDTYQPIEITEYLPNKVKLRVDTPIDTNLVLSDSWYPYWSATIDTKPVAITNWYGLRLVTITKGSHEVVFEYRYP